MTVNAVRFTMTATGFSQHYEIGIISHFIVSGNIEIHCFVTSW